MRITKLGAATLAASLTFGGAALAFADDAMPADPTVQEETTTTTAVEDPGATTTTTAVETPEPTTTTTVAPGDEATGEEEAAEGDAKEHPDNHGKIVSEAAHATPPGPGHGKAVSEIARSTNHGHTKADGAAKAKKPKKTDTGETGTG
jgi:hypothetical protein